MIYGLLLYRKNNDIKNVFCNVRACLLLFTTRISGQEASPTFLVLIDNWFFDIGFLLREFMQRGCTDFVVEKLNLEYTCVCLEERVVCCWFFHEMQIFWMDLKNWFKTPKSLLVYQ